MTLFHQSKLRKRILQITGTHWYSRQDIFKIVSLTMVYTQREFTRLYETSFKLIYLLFKPTHHISDSTGNQRRILATYLLILQTTIGVMKLANRGSVETFKASSSKDQHMAIFIGFEFPKPQSYPRDSPKHSVYSTCKKNLSVLPRLTSFHTCSRTRFGL